MPQARRRSRRHPDRHLAYVAYSLQTHTARSGYVVSQFLCESSIRSCYKLSGEAGYDMSR